MPEHFSTPTAIILKVGIAVIYTYCLATLQHLMKSGVKKTPQLSGVFCYYCVNEIIFSRQSNHDVPARVVYRVECQKNQYRAAMHLYYRRAKAG